MDCSKAYQARNKEAKVVVNSCIIMLDRINMRMCSIRWKKSLLITYDRNEINKGHLWELLGNINLWEAGNEALKASHFDSNIELARKEHKTIRFTDPMDGLGKEKKINPLILNGDDNDARDRPFM